MRIGIDAGGTFTDFLVLHGDGRLESFKIRSSRADPARVILEGLARIAGGLDADIVHGSTVATNAVLERKGAKVALVTTAGFEDVIHIGRQNRERLYDLMPPPRRPLVSREFCFGLDERTLFDGEVERAPNPTALKILTEQVRASGAESIALCLLHSYRNPANERLVLAALEAVSPVSASHEICPEFREYERTSTTVMNAYVRPLMESYLAELGRACAGSLFIMQSNGGLLPAGHAAFNAVRTVLSGPAGGVVGAIEMARDSGCE